MRKGWETIVVGAICLLVSSSAQAHPADVTHLLVKVDRHRVEVRLTFNLLTLMRFVPIDADQNGELTLVELKAAEPKLNDFCKERIPISINGSDETRLSSLGPMRPVWPTSEKPVIKAAEYDSHWVDVDCELPSEALVEDVWIGFEFFEETGYAHTIQGFFEQEGDRLEVPFTVAEPEFLYDTGFKPGDEPPSPATNEKLSTPFPTRWILVGIAAAGLFVVWTAVKRFKGQKT